MYDLNKWLYDLIKRQENTIKIIRTKFVNLDSKPWKHSVDFPPQDKKFKVSATCVTNNTYKLYID